jgi:hypothetical protein
VARAGRQQRWWKGACALLAAVSLLVATLAAGHRYFTCWMTGAALEPCCQHGAPDAQPTIDTEACCHARHFASPDEGVAMTPRWVLAAPVLAIVPIPALAAAVPAEAPSVDIRSARAGPARSSPNEYRIRLRVSLT